MPKDLQNEPMDQQLAERIAARRAKTQELKKRRRRIRLLQLILGVLLLVLIVVVLVFVLHALPGRRETPNQKEDPADAATPPIVQTMPDLPNEQEPQDATENPAPPQAPDAAEPNAPDEETSDPGTVAPPQAPPEEESNPGRYADTVVFVDPGRGYSDLGCTSDYLQGVNESEINLAVSKLVAEHLQAYGFTVLMTHETNEIPAGESEEYVLDQLTRVSMANTGSCDLYLSLHCDYFPDNPDASGTRLYYCTDVENSSVFADAIALSISKGMQIPPRIAGYETDAAFIVTSQVAAPSVLVELGFVTNADDAQLLLSEDWHKQIAQSLAAGVIAYFEANLHETEE